MQTWEVPVWVDSIPHVRYNPNIDLARAIKASDAALIFNSSVAVEARALGKPTGMLAAARYSHNADYIARGLCRPIESREDLISLCSCRLSPKQDEKLIEYIVATEGSARRIVQDAMKRCAAHATIAG
jgi:hypothetical protein